MAYEDYQVGQIQNAVRPMEGVSHPSEAIRADQSFWADTVAAGAQKLFTKDIDDGQAEFNADLNHVLNNIRNIRFAQEERIINVSQAKKDTSRQAAAIIGKYGANPKAIEAINKALKLEQDMVGELDNWKDPVQEAREAWVKEHPEMANLLTPTGDVAKDQARLLELDKNIGLKAAFTQAQQELSYRQNLFNYNDGITKANYAAQDQSQQNTMFANQMADRQLMDLQRLNLANTQSNFTRDLSTYTQEIDSLNLRIHNARTVEKDDVKAKELESQLSVKIQEAESLYTRTLNNMNSFRLSGNQTNTTLDQSLNSVTASYEGFRQRITGKAVGETLSGIQNTQDVVNTAPGYRGEKGQAALTKFLEMQTAELISTGVLDPFMNQLKDTNGNPITPMSVVPTLQLAHQAMLDPQAVATDVFSSITPTTQKIATLETLDMASRDAAVMLFSKGFDVVNQVALSEPNPTKQVQYYRQVHTNLAKPETLKGLNLAFSDNSGVTVINKNKLGNSIKLMSQSLEREWTAANNELGSEVVNATFVSQDGQVQKQVKMEDLVYVKFDDNLKRYNLEWREDVHEYSKANLSEQYHKLNTSIQSYQDTYLVNGVVSRNPRVVVDGQVNEKVGTAAAISMIFGNPERTEEKARNDLRIQQLMTPGPANLFGVSGVDAVRANVRTAEKDNQEKNAQTRKSANEFVQGIFGSDRKPAQ